MTINFTEGVGFIVFINLEKQEKLFQQLTGIFKKIDWNAEGAFFNYYGENKDSKAHAKIWIRANQSIIKEVRESVNNFKEETTIIECNVDSYVVCSKERNNLGEFDNFEKSNLWLIEIKEEGTKYAIEIKEELNVTPNTLTNGMLQKISQKISKEKPEMIKQFIKFHFVLNPLVHFDKGYETEEQIKQRCINNLL